MNRLVLAVAVVAAALPAGAAHATPADVATLCGYTTLTTDADGATRVEVDSGPIVLPGTGTDPATWPSGSVTCSVVYADGGAGSGTHLAYAPISVTGDTTRGVVHLTPVVVPGRDDHTNPQVICTQLNVVDGPTWYWDDATKTWSASPDVPCWDGVRQPSPTDRGDFESRVVDTLNTVLDVLNGVFSQVDPTICPKLAALAPGAGPVIVNGEGDVWIGSTDPANKLWDCPPYDV